ncbi:TPA: hypothetical protein RY214_004777 [Pseudomonas aeruginosa]|uniref:hypothetical protein n=1 Tax=Pseudomonas aeruginosa TaxID=287 RepID=UPI0021E22208|nr:hypothetical protein [Pseudomonas aeruginosa]MCV0038366.1 hypothetical protein [Pseudomonas aeruginosa]HCE5829341.1 hypothetical protein [Pseudomonas aeruginosa]HDV4150276.1 hypothetical protein [Pseudomonas aeruginosa]HEB0658033.1 hypothetical protein [Pseudomonas aeruginosa]HEB0699319.1 hypothetical protein [Pseudomonas aeruginosa]
MSNKVVTRAISRYAPLRYEATRPFAMTLGPRFHARAKLGFKERSRFLLHELLPSVRQALEALGRPTGPGPGQAELGNVQVFGGYLAGGRIVFDFHKRLTMALLETDVEAVPLSAIPRPADSVYLHFGAGSGVSIEGDVIEGAFVTWSEGLGEPRRLIVDFVKDGQFSDRLFWLQESGEPMVGCSVDMSEPGLGVIVALENSVREIEERNKAVFEQLAEAERQLERKYGEVVSIPSPVSRIGQNLPLLKRGLALVVNCLLYLRVAPEDRSDEWDDRADACLVDQATNAEKPGTRRTAERTLLNQGYVKIRYVGHQFASTAAGQGLGEIGRSVATHFRRGHFRSQPYGPERSLRKVIFIPPVVVNPGQSELPGRIYEV